MGPNRSMWAFQTPSSRLPDTFSDTFQKPSRHPSETLQTPTNKDQEDTFLPPSRHLTCTFQTPSIHNLDNIQTLQNIFQGQMGLNWSILGLPDTFQTPSRHLPDTFQTPSTHPPDTLQKPSRHSQIKANKTPSIHLPDTLHALSRHPPYTIKTTFRQ